MRLTLVALWMVLSMTSAFAQLSIGINLPSVSIGINVPSYPQLVRVRGYPVYYAPRLSSNFFFYDGMYWVYQGDDWYASSWYNGPWGRVDPVAVPLFLLRIPVRYYRNPPAYFRDWRPDGPPRWGDHWGRDWEQRRSGWDRWDRRSVPAPAPLPAYQRQYSGDRYPATAQQPVLRDRNYRYQPREAVVHQHYQEHAAPPPPMPVQPRAPRAPDNRDARPRAPQPALAPQQPHAPAAPPPPAPARQFPPGQAHAPAAAHTPTAAPPDRGLPHDVRQQPGKIREKHEERDEPRSR